MTNMNADPLALQVAGTTVGENLRKAIESGRLIQHLDGTFQFPGDRSVDRNYVRVGSNLDCHFLKRFLFKQAFGEAAIAPACHACYKIKVAPKTLRELVAAWQIAKTLECRSKWGIDLDNALSQDIYAGYFYVTSLEEARVLYKVVRSAFDADPKLGHGVSMRIKRGCSEYEAKIGPSDQWSYTPEMVELEAYLKARFREKSPRPPLPNSVMLGRWIELAYRIGDDTYLDFTKGVRLRPKSITYDP
jgi:hypothetical protein